MVEKGDTYVQRSVNQRRNILIGQTRNPHTAKRYFGSVKVAACNFDRIHLLPPVLKTIFGDCVLTHYNVDSMGACKSAGNGMVSSTAGCWGKDGKDAGCMCNPSQPSATRAVPPPDAGFCARRPASGGETGSRQ